ncbi:MAG: hypothetical protein ACJ73S_03830 [Mycobacteriales bacterium]
MTSAPEDGGATLDWRELPKPTDYRYLLPENWFALDPSPSRSMKSIKRIADARIRRFPPLEPHRKELMRVLRMQANDARKNGIEKIHMLAEPITDDIVMSASMVVAEARGLPLGGSAATNDPELITEWQRRIVPDEQIDDEFRSVDLVDLTQLPAVRVRAMIRTEDEEGRQIIGLGVQFHIPVPGSSDLVLLTFNTPDLAIAEQMTLLFDMIAQTFYFVWE